MRCEGWEREERDRDSEKERATKRDARRELKRDTQSERARERHKRHKREERYIYNKPQLNEKPIDVKG